ncbi:MAG: hypothetical protein II401_06405 [Bacteroidales bacterium]|nr:hypothetical protein [Bacteroidales bacterium]MBQ5478467.1 hypothetical protein [Bacteroidaceae bacterium]
MEKQLSFSTPDIESCIEAAKTTFDENVLAYMLLEIENSIRMRYADDALVSALEEYGVFHNEQCLRLAWFANTEQTLHKLRSMLFECSSYRMTSKLIDAHILSKQASNAKEVADLRAALYADIKSHNQ